VLILNEAVFLVCS